MAALSVSQAFSDLADPRVERTRLHSLQDFLVIALCAVLCGAEGWDDFVEFAHAKQEGLSARLTLQNGISCANTFRRVFARLDPEAFTAGCLRWTQGRAADRETGLRLANGIPCANTFRRVFARLDPQAFTAGFLRWPQAAAEESKASSLPVIAVDGKTLRHRFDTASEQKAVHRVSAGASSSRLVLAQTKVDETSTERPAVPAWLSLLDLAGCLVTAAAMSCQKTIAAQSGEQKGEDVLALKGNHDPLAEEVALLFAPAAAKRGDERPRSCGEAGGRASALLRRSGGTSVRAPAAKRGDERPHSVHTARQAEQGRLETRTCRVIAFSDLAGTWDDSVNQWSGLACLVELHTSRQVR